ncbi:RNA polymerase sigma factor [Terriglobus sp.]|uniref:RNA polymerase sigma factor n=1 Tax=Terriglobus sp. TaxID=1889013 RepID=UPI003B0074A0
MFRTIGIDGDGKWDGSADAFRALVNQHKSMVFSIAYRMLGDRGIAEEVAQDVFLELYRWMDRLESEAHITFWLRRTATHRSTDAIRRRKLRPETAAEEWEESFERAVFAGGGADAGDRAMSLSAQLERVLLTLPEQQRAAIVLRYQEDMSPNEIARVTGETVPAVKSNLQRGMALLRRKSAVLLREFVRG